MPTYKITATIETDDDPNMEEFGVDIEEALGDLGSTTVTSIEPV